MKFNLLIIGILTFALLSCGETDENVIDETKDVFEQPNEQEIEYETLIDAIDNNETLREGKSLFYSRDDGATEEVTLFVNDSNVTVKIYHEFTTPNAPSLSSNTYHFKDGIMISSKQLFEEGTTEEGHFSEVKTYYDKDEKPIVTKKRIAPYEDNLEFEQFTIIENQSLGYERPLQILNQEGEFATTFQGFMKEDPYLYMIVGENKPNGYYSSLVVQLMNPLINEMQKNEEEMKGTQLNVNFETLNSTEGYIYQILMSVDKK